MTQTTTLSPSPKAQFFTAAGVPLVGGKLYTYASGTTTPLATYTDSTGDTANTNPVILDSRGEANVWLGPSRYTWQLKDANDNLIWTAAGINSSPSAQSTTTVVAAEGQTVFTVQEYGLGGYLMVIVDGLVKEFNYDYTETNTTTITFGTGLTGGQRLFTRML
jgi:hypothetical protein